MNDLPHYLMVEKSGPVNGLPTVAPAMICGVRIPEITKPDQHKEHCIEAALLELDQKICMLFSRYGIGDYLMLSELVFGLLSRLMTTAE